MNHDLQTDAAEVRMVRLIWLALVVSILIYGALAFIEPRDKGRTPIAEPFSNPVIVGLYGMGAVAFLISFGVWSVLRRFDDDSATRRMSVPRARSAVSPRLRLAFILRWALIESVALFGLIASFLAADGKLFVPPGLLAIVGMIFSYPGDEVLAELSAD